MPVTELTTPASGTAVAPARAPGLATARGRRAISGSVWLAAGSAATFVVSALVVPLTIGYLGAGQFGMLMAAVAVVALCEPLDLGLGSALVTVLAAASASEDRARDAALVRAALRGLLVVAAVLVVVFGALLWTVDAATLLNADAASAPAALATTVVVLAGFVAGLPLALVDRVNLGYQDAGRVGRTTLAGQALTLALVAVAAWREAGVPVLAAALVAGPLVARVFAARGLLGRRPELRRASGRRPEASAALWRAAPLYFGLQLAVAVAFTSDQFVIVQMLGAEDVARYAVPARVFAVVSAAVAVVVRPLWPAFAEAAASGDAAWVKRAAARSIAGAAAFAALAAGAIVAAGPQLVSLLGRGEVTAGRGTLAVFGLWSVLAAVGAAVAMVLNGLAVVRIQLVLSSAMAVTNLALSIVLVRSHGVTGVLWGSVVAYGVWVVVPYAVLLRRIIDRRTAVAS